MKSIFFNLFKKIIFRFFILCLFMLGYSSGILAYEHPGGMHPKSQIEFVKKQIKLKNEPYFSAYQQLLVKADSSLTIKNHALTDFSVPGYYQKPQEHRKNSLTIQTDGFAAYSCALAWQLTGEKKYAKKALYFLNAWSSINIKYSDNDGPLVMAYSGTSMLIAAELMVPCKKWKSTDKVRFKSWVKKIFCKAADQIRHKKNNWGDWGRFGSILSAYFLDDEGNLRENIQLLKSDMFERISPDGHLTEEVKREGNGIWYSYFSLAPITAACWVAYNATGENLFLLQKDGSSIKAALDYLLYYNQHPSEWKWFKNPVTGSINSSQGFWPVNLLEAMKGIYLDNSYDAYVSPFRPIINTKHHYAWTFPTLMPLRIGNY